MKDSSSPKAFGLFDLADVTWTKGVVVNKSAVKKRTMKAIVVALSALTLTACGTGDGGGDGKGGGDGGSKAKAAKNLSATSLSTDFATDISTDFSTKVIYGDDNRLDLYDVKDARRLQLADSTVALIAAANVNVTGDKAHIAAMPFANAFGSPLCPTERFRDQSSAAFCSGFLIAPDIIVTAGHCIASDQGPKNDCSQTKIVFGFALNHAGDSLDAVPTSEVYSCVKVLKREQLSQGQDYSVIQLDRAVSNHQPLKLRASGAPEMTDELMVIGHPSGLPTKVADGAAVRLIRPDYIRASLDTYGGNSGSAVFNVRTNEVEGILVRGEQDFIYQGSCLVSKKCGQNDCRGEDVTRVSYVVPYAHEAQAATAH